MGCHTWFYKRSDRTLDECKAHLLAHLKQSVATYEGILSDPHYEGIDWQEWYPEWGTEHYQDELNKVRKNIEALESGAMSEDEIKRRQPDLDFRFIHGVLYEDAGYHDLFRIHDYPADFLYSLEECLAYIDRRGCVTYEYTNDKLEEFWEKHPGGLVKFG